MKVKELIRELSKFNEDTDIIISIKQPEDQQPVFKNLHRGEITGCSYAYNHDTCKGHYIINSYNYIQSKPI